MEKRGTFSGRLGFIMAAAGSAVGLGNIWRFPYLAAKYGGGIFLLVYIILTVTLGFTLMVTEIAIGRKTGNSAITAFGMLKKKYSFIGWLSSIIPLLIFPYYCVIGGWVLKYLVVFAAGGAAQAAQDTFFAQTTGAIASPIIYQSVYIILTALVIFRGVQKGIEKFSVVLMPLLILLSVIIAIYSVTLPGASEGVKYFLIPDFGRFSPNTVLAAMGQMFYSLSLAMGIMITYGSYLKKDDDIEKCVGRIEIFDTMVAILAGFMIIPAVFAFSGGDPTALNQGPSLMFITLPKVFNSMGGARIIGSLFFLLVAFAALTSSVSIMEACVSAICDRFKLSRNKSSVIILIYGLLAALLPTLGYSVLSNVSILGFDILDFMDFITNSVLMPIAALLTSLFVGWVIGAKVIGDEVRLSSKFSREKLYNVMIKYIAPLCIIAILASSLLSSLGVITL